MAKAGRAIVVLAGLLAAGIAAAVWLAARPGGPDGVATLGELEERIVSTQDGSITSIQAVYVPADDLADPGPAAIFSHIDASVVNGKLFSHGLFYKDFTAYHLPGLTDHCLKN